MGREGQVRDITRKERVFAALNNQPTDQIPFSFWRHFTGGNTVGKQCVRAHVDFYRATGVDFVKVMHDGLTAPCPLEVKEARDLWAYRPMGESNPYIRAYVERCSGVVDALGGEVYVYCNVFSPWALLRRIGDDLLAELMRTDAAAVRHALNVMSEELALLSRLVVEKAGCMGTFIAFQGAEKNRFADRAAFDEWVRPYDLRVLEAANSASEYNILHFCGWDGIPNRLECYREYPGCAVNWAVYVENLPLEAGRAYFGNRPVLGGFDNRRGKLLYAGERSAVEAETHRIVESYRAACGGTQGLIIGGDCSYLPDFELERFPWVRDTLASMK